MKLKIKRKNGPEVGDNIGLSKKIKHIHNSPELILEIKKDIERMNSLIELMVINLNGNLKSDEQYQLRQNILEFLRMKMDFLNRIYPDLYGQRTRY